MASSSQRVFTVEPRFNDFPFSLSFNQFSVEPEEGGILIVSFGFVSKGRLLDEIWSCAIPRETIEQTKESTLQYLGRIGEIQPMEMFPIRPTAKIVPTNVIGMAHRGDVADTLLHNFPFARTLALSKDTSFEADPVALLRSPLNVQKNLIRTLYQ